MLDPRLLQFDNIAYSDRFRSGSSLEQRQIKLAWLRDIMPQAYPQLLQDPKARGELTQHVLGFRVPEIHPLEGEVIRPETLSSNNFREIHENPAYRNAPFKDQQKLREIWFMKMARADPEFSELPDEERHGFFDKLMRSEPGYRPGPLDTGLFMPLIGSTTTSDTWMDLPEEDFQKRQRGLAQDLHNLVGNFARSVGALALGPARVLSGPDSGISIALENAQKEREWAQVATIGERIKPVDFTQSLVGNISGITMGPYMSFMKVMAGKTALTTAASGAPMITQVPGLLEKAGTALIGQKIPPLLYQTLGGTLAGATLGVNKALMEGKDWDTYLTSDMATGAGFQLMARYVGSALLLRKVAKGLGVKVEGLAAEPFAMEPGTPINKVLAKAWEGRPEMMELLSSVQVMNKHGVSLKNLHSKPGVKLAAQVLGRNARITEGKIEILSSNKANAKVVATFEGPDNVQIHNALNFLDNDTKAWDVWKKSAAGKHVMEAIETQPSIAMTKGVTVPSIAREYLFKQFKHYGVDGGIGRLSDARKKSELLDGIYHLLRDKSPTKVAEALRARGVSFASDTEGNLAAIKQMKADISTLIPRTPYMVLNSKSHKVVDQHNLPVFFGEHPDMTQPYVSKNAFVGTAGQVRQVLQTLKKISSHEKGTMTRLGNTKNIELHQYNLNEPVEFHVKVPGGGELYDAIIHFPTARAALDAMSKGKTTGLGNIIKDLFPGTNQWNKAYDAFVKGIKAHNPQQAQSEYLPFMFMNAQAAQQGKFLTASFGKYMLLDTINPTAKPMEFTSLRGVADHLINNNPLKTAPDLLSGMSLDLANSAFRAQGMKGVQDPLHFEPSEMAQEKARGGIGIIRFLRTRIQPAEYASRTLQRTEAAQYMREHYGISSVKAFNSIRDAARGEHAFINQHLAIKKDILKGLSTKQREYMRTYMEALDDMSEAIPGLNLQYQLKQDVLKSMTDALGAEKAQQVVQASTRSREYLDGMFKALGLDPAKYIKHYLPHLRETSLKVGNNLGVEPRRFLQIPQADTERFYRFTRTVDPNQLSLITDVDRLMEIYTRMAAKDLVTEPLMKNLGDHLRGVLHSVAAANKAQGQAVSEDDVKIIVNYIAEMMGTLDGMSTNTDQMARYAMSRTLQGLSQTVGKKFPGLGAQLAEKTHGSVDVIGNFTNLATASHIAGRAYPLARNMTQSLLTGGSLIQERWWLEGLSRVMANPQKSIQNIIRLGHVDPTKVPFGVGTTSVKSSGLVSKAMSPYMGTDWVNRAIVYEGMAARVDNAISRYASGAITKDQFIRDSGMRLFGKAQMNETMTMYNRAPSRETGLAAVKDRLTDLAVRESQYLYDKWSQPTIFRSGIGRIAGVYTTWPNNYFNFVKSKLLSDSMTAGEKAGFVARLAGNTALVAGAAYSAGVNPTSFLPWNSAVMAPGPHYQMMTDLALTLTGDRRAWTRFSSNLASLVPFASTGTSLDRGLRALAEGEFHEAFLLMSSSPIRYDLYPRRDSTMDVLLKQIQDQGNKFLDIRTESFHELVERF